MNVSWIEVPCIGQNGPITGYLLYYTNTTFNDTVNITGGDNRRYILTGLTLYTNYTVTVRAYNDAGIGPTSNEAIHQLIPSIHSLPFIISSSINIIKTVNNEKTSLIVLGTTSVIPLSKKIECMII